MGESNYSPQLCDQMTDSWLHSLWKGANRLIILLSLAELIFAPITVAWPPHLFIQLSRSSPCEVGCELECKRNTVWDAIWKRFKYLRSSNLVITSCYWSVQHFLVVKEAGEDVPRRECVAVATELRLLQLRINNIFIRSWQSTQNIKNSNRINSPHSRAEQKHSFIYCWLIQSTTSCVLLVILVIWW